MTTSFARRAGVARTILAVALCCGAFTAIAVHALARQQSPAWSLKVRGLPREIVEGQTLSIDVDYVAAKAPTRLNVELKDERNVVHRAVTTRVRGTGTARMSIVVPEGVLQRQGQLAVWFGDDWQQAHGSIVHTPVFRVLTRTELRDAQMAEDAAVGIRARLGLSSGAPRAAVVGGGWAGRSEATARGYAAALEAAGLRTVVLGPDEVSNAAVLRPRYVNLLLVAQARTYPGAGIAALERYLRDGGNLVILGGPAFDRLVQRVDGAWIDEDELTDRVRRTPSEASLVDYGDLEAADLERSSNSLKSPASWEIAKPGHEGEAVLHARIGDLTGWDTLDAPVRRAPEGRPNLVTFWARGGPKTTALAVEVRERDGSRWIATVPLTTTWRRNAVPLSSFVLWDPEGQSPRQHASTHLNLSNAAVVAVGLAFTHTRVPSGRHEYWIASLGTAHGPNWPRYAAPTLDTVSPAYKYYPVRGATSLRASAGDALVGPVRLPMPGRLLSTHPRPTGTGFDKGRKWRWIPLLEVLRRGEVAGTAATLLLHHRDGFAPGAWASFTPDDSRWYARPEVRRYVARVARRMVGGPFLLEAGARHFGMFPDEPMVLGARAAADTGPLEARFTVRAAGSTAPAFERRVALRDDDGVRVARLEWTPGRLAANRYEVTCELSRGGKAVDRLSHEVTVRHRRRVPRFMTVANGQFSDGGRPWYPHGVNYMPSSGIAIEDGPFFEQWLSSESYDPVVIERDLARIQRIGFNMISAFIYTGAMRSGNLVDLLNRCDAHGLKVNLSLRPGTPLDFEWPGIGDIIKANRLAGDDTIFAYDLAWEPFWGNYPQRRRWDGEWERWILERYGSLDSAEGDWATPVPRADGKVTGPSDADLSAGSKAPRMAAAYRRFLDNLLSRAYMRARQLVRTVDQHHLLSFRASIGGDPTANPASMPYDFRSLARSMSFMSPEGYGRIGEWAQVRPGWFTAAYTRMTAPGHPVLWAEFGYTIWSPASAGPVPPGLGFADAFERRFYAPASIAFTERYYRAFYEMAERSGSAGTVCWWYPGGFRFGENSDFGIIDPDGTWRGTTRIIAAASKRFTPARKLRRPDGWIAVDRDAHPDGLQGIYAATQERFWKLIGQGRFPGLRAAGEGTDSTNTPLLAVGNTRYNGHNPPKYLDAEYESLEVLGADGRWHSVVRGGTVIVRAGQPIAVRAVLGNNGMAKWVAPRRSAKAGGVYLEARAGKSAVRLPIPVDVARNGASALVRGSLPPIASRSRLVFGCVAAGRCRFGPRPSVELRTAPAARR
ncbi:MAG: hypothetical protein IT208_04345 [Chthonomonadales bacterium]|nr:hypothetical protein [Chthonomonadales bacterium]